MRAKDTLFEFYDEQAKVDAETGYMSSADDDELDDMKRSTTRRPRLTLRHLNKLRHFRKLKRQEQVTHHRDVARMYGNKSNEE